MIVLLSCMSVAKKGPIFTGNTNKTTIQFPCNNYKLSVIDKRTHVHHRSLKIPLVSFPGNADKISQKLGRKYFYLLREILKKNVTSGKLSLIFNVEVVDAYKEFKADTYSEHEGAYVKLRLFVKDKLTGKTLAQSEGISWGSQKTLNASQKSIEKMFRDALKMAFQDALNSISLEQLFAGQRTPENAQLETVEKFPASDLPMTDKPPFEAVGSERSDQSVGSSAIPLEPSVVIHNVAVNPASVPTGSRFDLVVDYSVSDPLNQNDRIPVKFSFRILRSEKVVFAQMPVELQALNGAKMSRILTLTANEEQGIYEIEAVLKYKDKMKSDTTQVKIK
jgi:hypothetical protein